MFIFTTVEMLTGRDATGRIVSKLDQHCESRVPWCTSTFPCSRIEEETGEVVFERELSEANAADRLSPQRVSPLFNASKA